MRIVHVTAGAGGRLCGSCLHDNTLVRGLRDRRLDALLVPAYVPTTTDEENVAIDRVVMGGLNVWLLEHVAAFRHLPRVAAALLSPLLDSRRLLAWLSGRTGATRAGDLGPFTVSALEGESGRHGREVEKLARWLSTAVQPDVIHLSNALLLGLARRVREATSGRIVCTLSGEDIFIEQLPEPHYSRVRSLLRQRAADVDGFVALNHSFATFMAEYLAVPREKITVVHHGVDRAGFPKTPPDLAARRQRPGGRLVVGSLARACPEKGLDVLVRSLPHLAREHDVEVLAAGAEVDAERDYVARCLAVARELGVADRFHWLGQLDRPGKLRLFESIDVFAMPTVHPEAKGLPVIESLAAGVPVVAADHGAFPELLDGERAGLLHRPADPADLARCLGRLLGDVDLATRCGRYGHVLALERHTAAAMAAAHEALYRRLMEGAADSIR